MSRPISLLLLTLLLSACSNRAMFETVQQDGLRRCEEIPIPQQASCKAQYDTSYDEYRRELERREIEERLADK